MHLFNNKKFEKLLKWQEWDHEVNLTEDASKELNAKFYAITIKKDKVLNQWLNEQLKAELIVELSSQYIILCFYILKKDRSLQLV